MNLENIEHCNYCFECRLSLTFLLNCYYGFKHS